MSILIVTDIFGLSQHIDDLMGQIEKSGCEVHVLDPYSGERRDFASDDDAYAFFCERGGHEMYLNMLTQQVTELKVSLLIGFSAGASAAWRLAGTTDIVAKNMRMLCFYPSQVAKYRELKPSIPLTLVMPNAEPHFDVASVCLQVAEYRSVSLHKTQYGHGFINPVSVGYSQDAEALGMSIIDAHIVRYISER